MIEKIVLLSGPISVGKTTLADELCAHLNMDIFKTREVLEREGIVNRFKNRKSLQQAGEHLDKMTRGAWVRDELVKWLNSHPDIRSVVVDSVRILDQINVIRRAFGPKVIHVHLTAPIKDLERRFSKRIKVGREIKTTYAKAHEDPTEKQVESLKSFADIVIDTKRCTAEDVLVRVSSHLTFRPGKGRGYVDVLIGGQYGSEGKGQISAYLSPEYDLLVRDGGPNAGHQVYEEPRPYTHHQLPSGTRKCEAKLLIGPGATLNVDQLLKEIAECNVDIDRLRIDHNAMIISEEDVAYEKEGIGIIGSTGKGVGKAMARRISGRLDSNPPKLARDIPELKPFLGSAIEVLAEVYKNSGRVFLEGTQGTELSLYHGSYPYVTSRDTSVSGCLAEAGIPIDRVRRIVMVCRTYPIRVKSPADGTSGPMSQEISWKEVGRRANKSEKELCQAELTSTTHKLRRVGEFDWKLLRKSALLNGPTDIALTFTDYLSPKNASAMRFEQLHPDTINFIQEIELVTRARVSLIATGFSTRSIIDRRLW
jgi:adenylosuccinate synthase